MPSPMIIRTVELCAGDAGHHPLQKGLMPNVHFNEDVRLSAIPAKMTLTNQ